MRSRWERWLRDLCLLARLKIPRCYKPKNFGNVVSAELHNFSDASKDGYGQCSYLRLTDDQNEIHCSLVMAKSRVAPMKMTTIPRLELTAALVSAKVSALLQKELEFEDLKQVFWTDSRIVLGYISNSSRRFHVFVTNRVQQIHNLSSKSEWRYIDTKVNPADYASHGFYAENLINCKAWWNGPEFLCSPIEDNYGIVENVSILPTNDAEVRTSSLSTKSSEFDDLEQRLCYFSDLNRAKRSLALCLRYKNILRNKAKQSKSIANTEMTTIRYAPLNVADLKEAEKEIIRSAQKGSFGEQIKGIKASQSRSCNHHNNRKNSSHNATIKRRSVLYKLDPFLDEDGLLRVGGRIIRSSLPTDLKHPYIIPKDCHIVKLLVTHHHQQCEHQGRGITLNHIRSSGYWIIGVTSLINHHIHQCVKCRRWRSFPQRQKMADLPKDRLEPAPPFTYSAVDCFGPWLIKDGRREVKRYGMLFTCMASRAIHLEVANSLDTNSFLNAYRRFVGRRGPVRQLRSDRGTNFIGARNELNAAVKEMDVDKIKRELMKDKCDMLELNPNVPHASHMGGIWEQQIRTARNVLRILLSNHGRQLDDESLCTVMIEAEAIVNSRPLTTESTFELTPLSPNNLLTMKSDVVLPPPGDFQRADIYSRKPWRRIQYLANEFWNQWRKGFLQSLQKRQKWIRPRKNIMIGDIVLVVEDNLPRNRWLLACVVETYMSKDGLTRKVKVITADSHLDKNGKRHDASTYLERPIQKVVVLLSDNENRRFPIEEPCPS